MQRFLPGFLIMGTPQRLAINRYYSLDRLADSLDPLYPRVVQRVS